MGKFCVNCPNGCTAAWADAVKHVQHAPVNITCSKTVDYLYTIWWDRLSYLTYYCMCDATTAPVLRYPITSFSVYLQDLVIFRITLLWCPVSRRFNVHLYTFCLSTCSIWYAFFLVLSNSCGNSVVEFFCNWLQFSFSYSSQKPSRVHRFRHECSLARRRLGLGTRTCSVIDCYVMALYDMPKHRKA